MLLGVLDLVEVQLDRLGETAQRLRDRAALAGHIDLKTLGHVPVFYLVHGCGEILRRIHNLQCGSSPILGLPDARDSDRPEGAGWLALRGVGCSPRLPGSARRHGADSNALRPAPIRR